MSNQPNALNLSIAAGRTNPDLVAKLKDGRILIVEHKRDHLVKESAKERSGGTIWQSVSDGKGVHVFARKDFGGKTVRDQIRDAIAVGE